ncbi:MAG: hypothetical protein K2V38_06085 [Gemmataceae bacterium]|nr:hypothetical protein [Gemmataceae bacterium]
MSEKIELPVVREEFGFARTACDCQACKAWCRHQPGYLVPSDLDRLVPPGADPFAWAEEHLRASAGFVGFSAGELVVAPSLVPAKGAGGACHWLSGGHCQVHAAAPYGCAFFDQHMSGQEGESRSQSARAARAEAFRSGSLYAQVWSHLREQGLTYRTGPRDREKVGRAIRRVVARRERRKARKRKQRQRVGRRRSQ